MQVLCLADLPGPFHCKPKRTKKKKQRKEDIVWPPAIALDPKLWFLSQDQHQQSQDSGCWFLLPPRIEGGGWQSLDKLLLCHPLLHPWFVFKHSMQESAEDRERSSTSSLHAGKEQGSSKMKGRTMRFVRQEMEGEPSAHFVQPQLQQTTATRLGTVPEIMFVLWWTIPSACQSPARRAELTTDVLEEYRDPRGGTLCPMLV